MLIQDENAMREAGFTGFCTVNELWRDPSVIPKVKGVNFVLYPGCEMPEFVAKGTGCNLKREEGKIHIEISRFAVNTLLKQGYISRNKINQNYYGRGLFGIDDFQGFLVSKVIYQEK